MMLLGLLLFLNAVLHGLIVGRFGIKGNEPPAVFGIVYVALSFAVLLGWPYGVVAALVVTGVGLAGLALNFKKLQHDPTVEKVIFAVGAAVIASAAYQLLGR